MKYSVSRFSLKWISLAVVLSAFINIPGKCQEGNSRVVRVVILPFRNEANLSGVNQFTDSLKFIIQKRFSLSIINDEELMSMVRQRDLNKKSPFDDEFTFASGKVLKADYVFSGELKFVNDSFDFKIQLREVNQRKIVQNFHFAHKSKQVLYKELLKNIPTDLVNDFKGNVLSAKVVDKTQPDVIIEPKTPQNQKSEKETERKTSLGQDKSAVSKTIIPGLYDTITAMLERKEFPNALHIAKTALSTQESDTSIVKILNKAYLYTAYHFLSEKDSYSSYSVLKNGVMLTGDMRLKKELAKIYRLTANESFYNTCIKNDTSEFATSLIYVKKDEILTLHKGNESHIGGWYMVDTYPMISETSSVGYIKVSSVKPFRDNKVVVVDLGKRDASARLFAMAVELNPNLKWPVMIDENRHLIIIITVIAIIIMLIVLRINPKVVDPVKPPVKKSKWQQRLEEAAKQRSLSPPRR
jgi:hypothetical protein